MKEGAGTKLIKSQVLLTTTFVHQNPVKVLEVQTMILTLQNCEILVTGAGFCTIGIFLRL